MENVQNLLCGMQVEFICAFKNTRTNAPSGSMTRNHSSAHAHKPKVYYVCALRTVYNLQIFNNYSPKWRWLAVDKVNRCFSIY